MTSEVTLLCFGVGSRRRSAPQVSDLIDTEGVTRARLFTVYTISVVLALPQLIPQSLFSKYDPPAYEVNCGRMNMMKKAKSKVQVKGKNAEPGESAQVFEAREARSVQEMFGSFASEIARIAGKPMTFFAAVAVVLIWAASGPFFEFSNTWQLGINTTTTIVTALMVFLIQNTQYRDTMALQLKLAELILVIEGTESKMALAEDLSHEDLETLKERVRSRTEKSD